MSPTSLPSSVTRTALHERAMRTVGDASSSRPTVVTLCGIVIKAPRMLARLKTARKKAGKCSGRQPIGTTTVSMPACSNHGL